MFAESVPQICCPQILPAQIQFCTSHRPMSCCPAGAATQRPSAQGRLTRSPVHRLAGPQSRDLYVADLPSR